MSLIAQIQDDVKTAMKNKDKERLAALRLITAAIKQEGVDVPVEVDGTGPLAILEKRVKQRKDSIEQFAKASRDDLIAKEQFELDIIQNYMPEQLSEAEISSLIDEAVAASGAASMKDMGKVMGQLKPKLQGRADMGLVSKLVKDKLS